MVLQKNLCIKRAHINANFENFVYLQDSPNNLFNFLESKKFSFAQIFCKFALEFNSYLCDFLALGEKKYLCFPVSTLLREKQLNISQDFLFG